MPLTACIGRDAERAALLHELERSRLITLTGPGGSGKTRLAIQLGQDLVETVGVWLVELDAVAEADLVAHAVACSLGLTIERDQTPTAVLCAALRDRQMVLLLDNREHVVAGCPALVGALLGQCPKLRIVATSRQRWVFPEKSWRPCCHSTFQGAACATTNCINTYRSSCFMERARAAAPGVQLGADNARHVAMICRQLEGMPLALELAAARVRALSPADLSGRLDAPLNVLNAPARSRPRQESLRATIDCREWMRGRVPALQARAGEHVELGARTSLEP